MMFLKAGVLGATGKEILKRFVWINQLLGMAAGNRFAQPRTWLLFECRQLATEA
jgi:hypothetical protein